MILRCQYNFRFDFGFLPSSLRSRMKKSWKCFEEKTENVAANINGFNALTIAGRFDRERVKLCGEFDYNGLTTKVKSHKNKITSYRSREMAETASKLSSRLLFWHSIWNMCCSGGFSCYANQMIQINSNDERLRSLFLRIPLEDAHTYTANANRAPSSSSIHHLRPGFLVSLILLQVKYWFIRINPFIHMHKYLPKKYGLSIVWWSANVATVAVRAYNVKADRRK